MSTSASGSSVRRVPNRWYDSYIFDLDGTIYLGDELLPGAAQLIGELKARQANVLFLTNKPLEAPADYAAKLTRLGIPTEPREVLTATDSLLYYLSSHAKDCRLYVIGEPLLVKLLQYSGYSISDQPDEIDLVVVSFDRTFDYAKLQIAFDAVRNGARIVATNPDAYCPVPGGGLPDCAAMLAALEACTSGKAEAIVGKPSRHMTDALMDRLGVDSFANTLLVGDRLATDIRMALAAGMSGGLMLTGATTRQEAELSAHRPHYILEHLLELIPSLNTPS